MSSELSVETSAPHVVSASAPVVIRAEKLGKKYRLGATTGVRNYRTLRESVSFGQRRDKESAPREFWATRDVSFEVREGEVLGIIGRNGAGKSTLLKMLSRITTPTEGRAFVTGRVGSLLEVGTGFHPELSGRENISLNGAILGMGRREILSKTDEIVAFSGVERFLDTPVKRYSSGMYLRLAFAVAAHLEPDILLVDEVLAVGDAEFQRKCIGRMSEVGASGRTVIFISHNMSAVLRLCPRLLMLDGGKVAHDGHAADVVRAYMDSGAGSSSQRTWASPEVAPGDEWARLKQIRVVDGDGRLPEEFEIDRAIQIQVDYWQLDTRDDVRPSVCVNLRNDAGVMLFHSHDFVNLDWRATPRQEGLVRATMVIPPNFLAEGRHFVTVGASSYEPHRTHFVEEEAVSLLVVDRTEGTGVRGRWRGEWPGVVRPMMEWSIEAPGR